MLSVILPKAVESIKKTLAFRFRMCYYSVEGFYVLVFTISQITSKLKSDRIAKKGEDL